MNRWELKTMRELIRRIRPDGPVQRAGVLTEVLVDDAAHEVIIQGRFERHPIDPAGGERPGGAADPLHAPIGGLVAGLERIVLAHKDRARVRLAPVRREHLELQDRRVVVQVAFEDRPLRHLPGARHARYVSKTRTSFASNFRKRWKTPTTTTVFAVTSGRTPR